MSIDPYIFGRDIYCDPVTEDADALFSEVTGVALVRQDLRHRLLTDSVQGPGGGDWGEHIRNYVGLTAAGIQAKQPAIKRAVLKDQRVDSVTVVITEGTPAQGIGAVSIDINGKTALGPFRMVFLLSPTAATLAAQVALIVNQ